MYNDENATSPSSRRVYDVTERGHGERAEREPIAGVWEQSPQRIPGAEPWSGAP